MAGKNIAQKILARAAGKEAVATGEYLIVRSKLPVTSEGDYLSRGPIQVMEAGAKKVFNPKLVKIVVGHVGAGGGKTIGEARRKIRRWAESVGVPRENILDLGQQGVEHIVAAEQCWVLPGELYFSVTDGHTTALGALGGFTVPLSYESGAYLIKGVSWVQVPEVARFTLTGKAKEGVSVRDVYEYILGQIGVIGTPNQVILWEGDYVAGLDMDARFTLCANALFSSAWTAIIEPDPVTLEYVRAAPRNLLTRSTVMRTPNTLSIGSSMSRASNPRSYLLRSGRTFVPSRPMKGMKITKGHIGACTNGRMSDMRVAAKDSEGPEGTPRCDAQHHSGVCCDLSSMP